MDENNQNIPEQYKPLSPWAYFGYNLLFAIPIIGIIFAIIYAFDSSNINRRNYARSFFCILAIVVVLWMILISMGVAAGITAGLMS